MRTCYIRTLSLAALFVLAVCLMPLQSDAGTAWNSLRAGNPVLPGYFADPCARKFGDTYYLYVTPDGWDVGRGPFCIWTSKDFVHWTSHKSPGSIPGTFWPSTDFKWAPSVIKHNNKYYLYNQTPCMIWGAVSDTPLGPWTSLSEPGKPMIPDQTPKGSIVLDGEIFIDTDGQRYMWYSTWWTPTVAKLKDDMATIDGNPIQYFKREDNQTPYGTVQGCMEAPYMFKHNGTYYLMYSNNMCQNSTYDVEYSYSKSPLGPFTYGKNNPILSTNEDDTVDGPGHHTILEDGGKVYIVYHRHDNPHAADGAHRQTAIDELHFAADGSIEKVVATHSGVGYLAPSTVRDTNVALGKKATASSFAGNDFNPGYAMDENNGTLWKATEYKYPQWLTVDLGKPQKIVRAETEFQFAQVGYKYVIESSNDGKTWTKFADRSNNTDWGPTIDKGDATARYFRITLLGDDSPQRPAPEVAIWNLKLYDGIDKPNQAPVVDVGPDMDGTVNFPTRVLDATVTDDGLPNGPVTLKWTKVSGPGEVNFEHPDRAYTKVTFPGAGTYVLKLSANDGKLTGSDSITVKIMPPGDQLISYKFDEKDGCVARDSSINGQNGVMAVGAQRSLGMYGGAINMNVGDFVNVPSLGTQSKLTIATWINPHTLPADQNSLVCSSGENGFVQATIDRAGEIRLALGGQQVAVSDFKFTPETLGSWKHIAIEYDSVAKTASFYVDGKLDSTRTLQSAPALDLSSGLRVGGAVNGVRGLDGELDDFSLYGVALSAQQIAAMAKPAKFPTISEIKNLPDGSPVTLLAKAVTWAPMNPISFERSTDYFYISERDGSDGIMVKDGNAGQDKVVPDSCVSFTGVMRKSESGERYVELVTSPSNGAPYNVKPQALNGGSACKLVSLSGKVSGLAADGMAFSVTPDSGSAIKAEVSKGTILKRFADGNTVQVRGVVGKNSGGQPVLLVRDVLRTNPPADPLLVHYTFDGDADDVVKDASTNANDGKPVGGPFYVEGHSGKAICFDGKKTYIQLPDLGLLPSMTLAVWVKLTSMGTDGWSTSILHSDTWQNGDLHLQIPVKAGNVGAAVGGSGDVNTRFSFVENQGKWVHVAFTFDAQTHQMALYINGKHEGTSNPGTTRPMDLTRSKIGTWGASSRWIDGAMDDFRLYDIALNDQQIEDIYNGK